MELTIFKSQTYSLLKKRPRYHKRRKRRIESHTRKSADQVVQKKGSSVQLQQGGSQVLYILYQNILNDYFGTEGIYIAVFTIFLMQIYSLI
jgi:hypothetical protein